MAVTITEPEIQTNHYRHAAKMQLLNQTVRPLAYTKMKVDRGDIGRSLSEQTFRLGGGCN